MYIEEYLNQHPEKLPKGQDLMKFADICEGYIEYCRDLIPYNSPNYISDLFDMCIGLAKDRNKHFNNYGYYEENYCG